MVRLGSGGVGREGDGLLGCESGLAASRPGTTMVNWGRSAIGYTSREMPAAKPMMMETTTTNPAVNFALGSTICTMGPR